MSLHSYSKLWVHLIWATLDREPMLSKPAAEKVRAWLTHYAREKGIFLMVSYFNADHVHALIDLPTNLSVEKVAQLFKGASSHWINEQRLVNGKFSWGRGYGAFSVSESAVTEVSAYIAGQEEHHRKRSFTEELKLFVERYRLKWQDEETVETVSRRATPQDTPLKRGVDISPGRAIKTPLKQGVNERVS